MRQGFRSLLEYEGRQEAELTKEMQGGIGNGNQKPI